MHSHCENCVKVYKCTKSNKVNCPIISCNLQCGCKFHQCKEEEHKQLCINEIVPCINVDYGCPIKMQRYRISSHLPNCPASVVVCTLLLDHWPLYPELGDKSMSLKDTMVTTNGLPSSFLGIDIPSDIATSYNTMPYSYSPSCKMGENFNMFTINPIKPYTFSCNQSFRREEYNWHYKNVHNDIHCSLNGPIIHWCPLAQYGCNFSRKRLYPAPTGSLISYNNIVGSFGVIPLPQMARDNSCNDINYAGSSHSETQASHCNGDLDYVNSTESEKIDYFSIMPFEILQKIAWFLDSFSLANLSLTSRHIRNVCKTLLEKKGMVHVVWVKNNLNGKDTWKITSYRWCFSNGMSPITQWIYLDGMNMSNHMKTCRYYKKKVFKDEHLKQCKLFDPSVQY